jgi:hypothetical protein
MFYDSDVIEGVCSYLESQGFRVLSRKVDTNLAKNDIRALSPDGSFEVIIEAKGDVVSEEGNSDYGKPLNLDHCRRHVADANVRAAILLRKGGEKALFAGIALPKTEEYVKAIGSVEKSLKRRKVEIFWMDSRRNVVPAGNWRIFE